MQTVQLFENFTKEKWIKQLICKESAFFELVKEDVYQLWSRTGGFKSDLLSFDELYTLSVDDTIRQFEKNLSKKTNWLFALCSNNKVIYQKLKSRLVNNIRNLYDPKRRKNIINIEFELTSNTLNQSEFEDHFVLQDLQKLVIENKQIVIDKFRAIRLTYTNEEFEDLCLKIGLDPIEDFPNSNLQIDVKVDRTNQLVMEF